MPPGHRLIAAVANLLWRTGVGVELSSQRGNSRHGSLEGGSLSWPRGRAGALRAHAGPVGAAAVLRRSHPRAVSRFDSAAPPSVGRIPHAHARGIRRVRPLVLQHLDVGYRQLARIRGSLHGTEDVVPELPVGSVLLLDLRTYLFQRSGDLSTPLMRDLLPELLLTLVLICPAQTDERFRKSKRPRA